MNAPESERKAAGACAARHESPGSSACTHAADCFLPAWIAGLLLAFLQQSILTLCGAALLTAAGCVLLRRLFRAHFREILAALAGLLLGIGAWTIYDLRVRQPLLAMDGETVTLTGEVTAADALTGDRMRYTLRTELTGRCVSADWYAGAEVQHLSVGDSVTLSAELTRITQDYRSHTADYQAGMGKYLRIYNAEVLGTEPDTDFSLRRAADAYRTHLTGLIGARLAPAESGLLCAMLFGDKTALSDETADSLYRAGIGHITAVSGLHLVFFCALIAWLLRRLTASPKLVLAGCALGIAAFILLVDSSVSVYRAAVMVLLHISAPLFGRRSDSLRSLGLAMFLCTVFTPYVIGSVSFWLSVSGVFGIAIAAPYLTARLHLSGFSAHMLSLVTVSAAVFPASLLLTGETSLIAPLCNLIILPLACTALYIGLILVCTGGLTAFLLPAAGFLCRCTVLTAEAAADLPFSHIGAAFPAVSVILILGTLTLLVMFICKAAPRVIFAGCLGTAVLMAFSLLAGTLLTNRSLRIAVLGQRSECLLLLTEGGCTVAADLTGAVRSPAYAETFLRENGLTRIDILLLPDAGSAAAYQQAFRTGSIGEIRIFHTAAWNENVTVCGTKPVFAGDSVQEIRFADTLLRFDGKTAAITHGDQTVCAVPADAEAVTADAVIRYGKKAPAADDICAMRLIPQQDGNNHLLTLSGDTVRCTPLE